MTNALYAEDPMDRLVAARRLRDRQRRTLVRNAMEWPADSPGAHNAWLIMVTTKPPTWRDPYVLWRDRPLTIGEPHEGFFYPDPLGFWAEVRHWASMISGLHITEAVSVSALLHGADQLDRATEMMQPEVVLFLDEPAWQAVDWSAIASPQHIADPYRPGKVYEGWWGRTADGLMIGKSPQHPAAHKLYRREDMDRYLSWPGRDVST